jgi:hypothetical protein
LGLAAEPGKFARAHEAELLHARWAMLGAVGALVPEGLAMAGVDLGEAVWWRVGAAKLKGDVTLNWGGIEGFRLAGKQGIWLIAACQVCLLECWLGKWWFAAAAAACSSARCCVCLKLNNKPLAPPPKPLPQSLSTKKNQGRLDGRPRVCALRGHPLVGAGGRVFTRLPRRKLSGRRAV